MNGNDSAATLEGLADKIDRLDLTDAEQAALATILGRAASATPEVAGFGVVFEVETTLHDGHKNMLVLGDGNTLRTQLAFASGLDPNKVWTDMRP